jgi:hypothetical protein
MNVFQSTFRTLEVAIQNDSDCRLEAGSGGKVVYHLNYVITRKDLEGTEQMGVELLEQDVPARSRIKMGLKLKLHGLKKGEHQVHISLTANKQIVATLPENITIKLW